MKIEQPVGILGGTFDPIHNGHLYIASSIHQKLLIKEIKFTPCYVPVHRDIPHTSTKDRITMINLALENYPHFTLDQREILRQEPSFMIDTLTSFRNEYTQSPLCLILGADAYLKIPSWKKWKELLDYAHFVVVNRPSYDFKQHPNAWLESKEITETQFLFENLNGGVFFLNISPSLISATVIRQKILHHETIADLVPFNVANYIEQHELYL